MAKGTDAGRFAAFVADLLQPMGPVAARRMFSGSGLFCDGLMFGLIFADVLYLKTDAASQAQFEDEGSKPFEYTAKGRSIALNYWRLPERLLDDPDEFIDWSRVALGVARRAAARKVKSPPPRDGKRAAAKRAQPKASAKRRGR